MNRQNVQTPRTTVHPPILGILQRACACGKHASEGQECSDCRKKNEGSLQRLAAGHGKIHSVPPIVQEVLSSPGRPLDGAFRSTVEPLFGQDFSGVRVHTDGKANESARAVNALAYTVGSDVVFSAGQHASGTVSGKRLLAHELTHVVQQGNRRRLQAKLEVGPVDDHYEKEADRVSDRVVRGQEGIGPLVAAPASLQRRLGDGHDLTATRFAGNAVLEDAFDDRTLIKKRSSGTAVRLIQESLLAQGYALPRFGADGKFGDETEAAVRRFQIDAGAVLLDGIVGPETMGLLDMHDPGATTRTGPGPAPAIGPPPPPATGVVFQESPDEVFAGYDASTPTDSLVVPVNGRRRARAVVNPAPARPTFVSLNPAVASVETTPNGIAVTGVAAGTTNVQAQEGAAVLDTLQISVKNQISRSVAFNFVCDSRPAAAGGPHCSNGQPGADDMRSLLNRVWERQANVLFTGGASQNAVVAGDLGPYVNDDGFGGDEMATVVAAAPALADYNVFRVWDVRVAHGAVNGALNNGNNTLIADAPCADGLGLPHECGHFLGLGHGSGFIMTPCGGRVDRRVSRAMADLVNP